MAEIIVVDDGSTDATAAGRRRPRRPRAVVSLLDGQRCGHQARRPRRHRRGDRVHGRRRPAQRLRTSAGCWRRLAEGYDMVVGARDSSGQANLQAAASANALYNRLASWMTGHDILDLTSGFRAVRAEQFPRVPAPAAQRLQLSHHQHHGVLPQRLSGGLRADPGGPAGRQRQPHPSAEGRHPLPADHLQDRDAVFAAEVVRAHVGRVLRCSAPGITVSLSRPCTGSPT